MMYKINFIIIIKQSIAFRLGRETMMFACI